MRSRLFRSGLLRSCLALLPVLVPAGALLATAGNTAGNTAGPAALTPQELRGRQIYRAGTSPSGAEITAVLSDGAVQLPAASMTCMSCHGRDGRGRPEGGVSPSNLTWEALTKPYGVTHPSGRTHPPYTERLLKRAVTLGIDPAGNKLHVAMPRYRLSQADADDLVAYLKRLGAEPEPGVSPAAVRIGVLPPAGPEGESLRALLLSWFDGVNRRGGVYGRQIELVPLIPSAAAPLTAVLDREPVFAVVGTALAGDDETAALLESREIPVVGAVSSQPRRSSQQVFYLYSGLEEQARALLELAGRAEGGKDPRLAIVGAEDDAFSPLVQAVEQEAESRGWKILQTFRLAAGAADLEGRFRSLQQAGAELLFLAAPGAEQARWLAAADRLGWRPRILTPGPLAGGGLLEAPSGFDRRIFLAFPTLPTDTSPAARAEVQQLTGLAGAGAPAHLASLAAAKLLMEALNRTGHELTRERLIASLEKIDRFETGLTPTLAYGPGRRIGARGAYVVTLDLANKGFLPASGWIAVK
jgi:ABC-type branched-subunit amino acid transport system substrate-binding protein